MCSCSLPWYETKTFSIKFGQRNVVTYHVCEEHKITYPAAHNVMSEGITPEEAEEKYKEYKNQS